ncbi:MAG: antitoxin [Mycobacterium sp.]
MKVSVSLSDTDLALLDAYVRGSGLPSRSAGVQRAIGMLRFPHLEEDYRDAWAEWSTSEGENVWDEANGDGLADAPR